MFKNNKNIQNRYNILLLITIAIILFVTILGSTMAWFTDEDVLNGDGTTPYVSVSIFDNGTKVGATENQASTSIFVTPTINNMGQSLPPRPLQFNLAGTTIDTLVRMRISIEWAEGVPSSTEGFTLNINGIDWLSTSTGSNLEKINNGWFYYKFKVTKASVANLLTIFNTITIAGAGSAFNACANKTAQIGIYVEAVQANLTGLNLWRGDGQSNIPSAWNPLG